MCQWSKSIASPRKRRPPRLPEISVVTALCRPDEAPLLVQVTPCRGFFVDAIRVARPEHKKKILFRQGRKNGVFPLEARNHSGRLICSMFKPCCPCGSMSPRCVRRQPGSRIPSERFRPPHPCNPRPPLPPAPPPPQPPVPPLPGPCSSSGEIMPLQLPTISIPHVACRRYLLGIQ